MSVSVFINTYIRFFFLLTPFLLLSTFLAMTENMSCSEKRHIAVKTTFAVIVISTVLFFIGDQLFNALGITLNSFRVGTGALLFLSAKDLISDTDKIKAADGKEDISIVPLALPVTVGPATTGALLLMGTDLDGFMNKACGLAAVIAAILTVGFLLIISGYIEKAVKQKGLAILKKVTGLILSALSAEMILTGIKGFFV